MTQVDKELLLKDISARLPYGVIVAYKNQENKDGCVKLGYGNIGYVAELGRGWWTVCKPYLRPMSSMTDEENKIVDNISNKGKGFEEDEDGWIRCDSIHTKWGVWPDGCANLLDYLNSIHIDYRGLIPMGLALEAPEGMYKFD